MQCTRTERLASRDRALSAHGILIFAGFPPKSRAVNATERQLEVAIGQEWTGERLDRTLAAQGLDLSRERIKALIGAGLVTDTRGTRHTTPSARIVAPLVLRLRVPLASAAPNAPQDLALVIAYEDEHLIVVDKPAGMVVHPAAGNADGTLVNALLHHCAGQLSGIGGVARPGIVHRIDKGTSGLIVAAKSDRVHEGLARQFADHSILRRYHAIVQGVPQPPRGRIEGAIARASANRKTMAIVPDGRGKHAVTHYALLAPLRGASLVECRLETGRTHQVRVHMTSIGHSLLGDPAYGRVRGELAAIVKSVRFDRQALHAAELGFTHPVTGAAIALESALPADMQELLALLRV